MNFQTVDEANAEFEKMQEDVRGDMGEEGLEAGWFDLVCSAAEMCATFGVASEFARMHLGYLPEAVARRFLSRA